MEQWAKREIELACKRELGEKYPTEWKYVVACYESAFKALKSLITDEHSCFSIDITMNILSRLVKGKPLTPIEDTPDAWHEVGFTKQDFAKNLQCNRMSSFWKEIYHDGTIKYVDNNRVVVCCIDNQTVGWHNRRIVDLIDEIFPITMPYFPENNPYKVYVYQGLTNPKNGDYDTTAVFYVIKPDGERVEINRYFDDYKEITKEEYLEREKRFVNSGHEKFKIN